ncbi:MAG: hypothetical protein GY855_06045, partial [candidate division Zixibacteria bacterium]|nr:hypothetical protein [candidate division Zixibacteria bacterium]
MKNPQLLIKICLGLGIFALLMTVGDYLALHDIWHDYVSKQVIEKHGGSTILNLPDWTEARLEWRMVNISGLIKAFYIILSLATFVICLKALRKKSPS